MEKIYRGMANGAETIDRNFDNGYGQRVGDIHISIDSTNPSARFGGTWERFANGRTLVGVDESDSVNLMKTSNQKGGTTNPLSEHNHTIRMIHGGGAAGATVEKYGIKFSSSNDWRYGDLTLGSDTNDALPASGTGAVAKLKGSNTNHNNWQPFVTVYMWVRTA